MNIDATRQSILNKGHLDKFLMVLNLPKVMKNIVAKTLRTQELVNLDALQYSIYSAPVPPISVPHINLPFAGQVAKVSSHARPTYPPLQVAFTIDNRFNNWWVLWKWLDILNDAERSVWHDPDTSKADSRKIVGTLKDYATIISVYGRDEFNKKVIEFKYYDAFITDLSEIGYNYRNPDELSATFTLQYGQFEALLIEV